MDAKELIQRCQRGDRESFGQLFEQYKDFVYNIAFQFFQEKESAEDVTQEVFVRLFLGIKNFRFRSAFRTYVARIAMNLCRDRWRRRKKEILTGEVVIESVFPQEEEDLQQLRKALTQIPVRYREVILLKEIEGFSIKEISEALRAREGTVKSWHHRGKKLLREAFDALS